MSRRMQPEIEIRFSRLHKFFQRRHLLNDLSLSLKSGAVTLLCGENGSGKTTLLRILCGMEKPAQCWVAFNAKNSAGAANNGKANAPRPWRQCRPQLQRQVMYLHQQPYLFDGSVVRNLALALPRNLPAAQRAEQIQRALAWAQLDDLAHARAKTLSSGQMQRVSLARARLRQARIWLLDEPTANMDRAAQTRTVALLKQLKQARTALLIASHHHEIFAELADTCLTLKQGRLIRTP